MIAVVANAVMVTVCLVGFVLAPTPGESGAWFVALFGWGMALLWGWNQRQISRSTLAPGEVQRRGEGVDALQVGALRKLQLRLLLLLPDRFWRWWHFTVRRNWHGPIFYSLITPSGEGVIEICERCKTWRIAVRDSTIEQGWRLDHLGVALVRAGEMVQRDQPHVASEFFILAQDFSSERK